MIQAAMEGANAILSGVGAYVSGMKANTQVSVNNILGEGQTRINNTILRPAQNQQTAAFGNLNRWVQANANKNVLESGSSRVASHITNTLRNNDQMVSSSLSQQIAAAEQEGMAAAQQAFNGVAGGVADMVNMTTALRQDISDTLAWRTGYQINNDAGRMAGQLFTQMVNGLDNNILLDVMDYSVDHFTKQKEGDPYTAALLAGASSLLKSGAGQGLSNMLGGPKSPASNSFGSQLGFTNTGNASFGSGLSVNESVAFFNASSPGLGALD